jgi:hypothetical protein
VKILGRVFQLDNDEGVEAPSLLARRTAALSTPDLIQWMGQCLNDQAMAMRAIESHLSPEGVEEAQRATDVQQAIITELRRRSASRF